MRGQKVKARQPDAKAGRGRRHGRCRIGSRSQQGDALQVYDSVIKKEKRNTETGASGYLMEHQNLTAVVWGAGILERVLQASDVFASAFNGIWLSLRESTGVIKQTTTEHTGKVIGNTINLKRS